jgi:uncharacterized protein (TIGR02001 family)
MHVMAAGALSVLLAGPCVAADYSAYAALTTNYVYRGVTQSDNAAAIQLGIDAVTENGFFLGAWGSTVDIEFGSTGGRDIELNFYGGYSRNVSDRWTVAAQAVMYVYPGQTGSIDYDYEEYSLTANLDDRIWLEFAYSPDLYHSGSSTTNIELFSERPLSSRWTLSGGIGHYDTSDLSGRSYNYWQLGVTRSMEWAELDFRYHDTDDWVPVVSNPQRAKAQIEVKLQVPF